MSTNDVQHVLSKYPEIFLAHVDPLGMAGGLSGALFWRVAAPGSSYILRRWPHEHPSPERLSWIHELLAHVHRMGLAHVPVPVSTMSGETFITHRGHLWEVTPWLPGVPDNDEHPRLERLRNALVALAKFHQAAADFARPAAKEMNAVQKRLGRLRELSPARIAELERAIDSAIWPELAPLAREAVANLPPAIDAARAQLAPFESRSLPLQSCIRDIWRDHVLFTGDKVTGLIDFGAAAIDTPTTDIARLLGSFAGHDQERWKIGIDAYCDVRELSEDERALPPSLDDAATVIASTNWIRWIYVERRDFNDRSQVVARLEMLVQRLRSRRT